MNFIKTAALSLLASSVAAIAGSPRVAHVYPAGIQRGGEMEITCSGSNLEDARTLLFGNPGFEVTAVKAEKTRFKVKVKATPDAALGEHRFRVITQSGVADLRLFYVTPFPLVEEQAEDKANPSKPQPVALGTTVYGRTQNEDQDHFEVELKKGQRLSAEAIATRLQTQSIYDCQLIIAKVDGTSLLDVDDTAFSRQDPVVSFLAPEDGKYLVIIKDSTNAGPGECHYLLNLGSFPRPIAVYPSGGPAGEEMKVKLIGDALGPIEKTVQLPAESHDRFPVFPEDTQTAPQPHFLRVSKFPNVLESEPNNEVATATATETLLPLAFNGIIGEKGDIDYFKFTAKKGQDYDVSVFGRRLRSPLDSMLEIYDAKGTRIGGNDDSGGVDSYLRWKAPADGAFFAAVRDQLLRGGEAFTYRIEVKPVEPKITAWLPAMVINSSQERRALVVPKGNRYASLVRVKRSDAAGTVALEAGNLPPGVKADAPLIDKSVDTVPVVFEAASEAPLTETAVTLQARLQEPPPGVAVGSGVEHEVEISENGNQRPYYTVTENRLALAVTEEIPVKLSLSAPKVPVLQTGSMNLKVVAERKGDFKGPISLALLYSPTGIGTAGTVQINESATEGVVTLSASATAPLQKWKVCVVGSADFGKGPVWMSTALVDLEVAAPLLDGKISRSFVDQGDSTTVSVKLDHKQPFEGKAKVALLGLPPNCTAEEKEIGKDDTEATFTLKAGKDAPPGQHKQLFCQFTLTKDGETMTSSFGSGGILRVDKAAVVKNEEVRK